MKLADCIEQLSIQGQHYFTTEEIIRSLSLSKTNAWASIIRLEKKGLIASPFRGFYVIVPPEYRHLRCLPPEQFIADLMAYLELPYYVGLLSAAQYYGSAHQQTQLFQVVTSRNRSSISCGQVRIQFIARKNMAELPTQTFNTPKGYLRVSTPELTALDLANYPFHSAGLNNIVTVLEELSEKMKQKAFGELAKKLPSTPQWQRLGFLLEAAGQEKLAQRVETILKKRTFRLVPLVPKIKNAGETKMPCNPRWKVIQNESIESDL